MENKLNMLMKDLWALFNQRPQKYLPIYTDQYEQIQISLVSQNETRNKCKNEIIFNTKV